MMQALGFLAVVATVYFVTPYAIPSFEPTIIQSAAITLLAFVARAVLTPDMPEVYLVNAKQYEEEID
jgi:hypothetical protein